MRGMADASVDSIVTDPPYHLTQASRGGHARTNNPEMPHGRHRIGDKGFMGKVWDGGDIAQRVEMWAECLRVLKPGGHVLAFSSSRTYHRMVCSIEDAGFEIRDQIMWIYGSGFPKSKNLEGEHAGWGTALKPAHEPICVARKPLSERTVAKNVAAHGTGAINIDACRIATAESLRAGAGTTWKKIHEGEGRHIGAAGWGGPMKRLTAAPGQQGKLVPRTDPHDGGRWPANVIHDGSDEVVSLFPAHAGAFAPVLGIEPSSSTKAVYGQINRQASNAFHDDTGSAARFFYCAKTSRDDRSAENNHPTVKPTDLMAYLCRLVTPPGGVVLDPFMGSGSTGKACMREGFEFIGIELEAEYLAIAKARIEHEQRLPQQQRMFA